MVACVESCGDRVVCPDQTGVTAFGWTGWAPRAGGEGRWRGTVSAVKRAPHGGCGGFRTGPGTVGRGGGDLL